MFSKSYFSNLYLFLCFILFFIGTGFSQNVSYLDSLDGKFALQFQIEALFRAGEQPIQRTVIPLAHCFAQRASSASAAM